MEGSHPSTSLELPSDNDHDSHSTQASRLPIELVLAPYRYCSSVIAFTQKSIGSNYMPTGKLLGIVTQLSMI